MKKPFIHPDFLLDTKSAQRLYHGYAEPLPIIDYHGHLAPRDIAEDRRFENMTRIWLAGDHYKWRAMRACGVEETYITGRASDREKFEMWARTVPKTLRNPLFHWTHLELVRAFGLRDLVLNEETSQAVWDKCNALLRTDGFTARGLLSRMNVELVCTTDDPVDTLEFHRAYAKAAAKAKGEAGIRLRLVPAWRPDRILAVEDAASFNAYLGKLESAANVEIRSFASLVEALRVRHLFFHDNGCRLSDHGIEAPCADDYTSAGVERILEGLRLGRRPAPSQVASFKSALLYELALMDFEKGWVQQFHLGALRNVNSRMMRDLGPDAGADAIGDWEIARPLAAFLDRLDADGRLPKTILYNLNPKDNEAVAALAGCFQDGKTPGKIQVGPAWWFLDQMDGMTRQLESLSSLGLLGLFVGMTTDSRSLLSFPRHEYFRRLLCRILGREMEAGLLPSDTGLIGSLVVDVCYHNARRYFRLAGEPESSTSSEAPPAEPDAPVKKAKP
jgi:glucuronate isomerase